MHDAAAGLSPELRSRAAGAGAAVRALLEALVTARGGMVWGYLKSELQALPLEPDHNYSVGRKLDSDLVLKVRRPCLPHPPVTSPCRHRALRARSRGAYRASTA